MTEREWLECNDSRRMYYQIWKVATDRKTRLFAVAF
jgi:hypothetical protein